MAKVTYYNSEDDRVSVRGRFRSLEVSYDGSFYRITQCAHIDDSGHSKLREWGGEFVERAEAVKAAENYADSQY